MKEKSEKSESKEITHSPKTLMEKGFLAVCFLVQLPCVHEKTSQRVFLSVGCAMGISAECGIQENYRSLSSE